MGNSAHWFC